MQDRVVQKDANMSKFLVSHAIHVSFTLITPLQNKDMPAHRGVNRRNKNTATTIEIQPYNGVFVPAVARVILDYDKYLY